MDDGAPFFFHPGIGLGGAYRETQGVCGGVVVVVSVLK